MNAKITAASEVIDLTVYDSALYGKVCPLSEVKVAIDLVEKATLLKTAEAVRDSFALTMDGKISAMAMEKYQLILNTYNQ